MQDFLGRPGGQDAYAEMLGALAFANEMPLYKIPAMSRGACGDARINELVRVFGG